MVVQLLCCACGIPYRPRLSSYAVWKRQINGLIFLRITTCDLGSLFLSLFLASLRFVIIIHKSSELRRGTMYSSIDRIFFSLSFFFFSFILADKAVGQLGFKAIWTEVSTNTDCQNQFLCSKNKYCIAESLRCNEVYNCGPADDSDEENCKFRKR